MLKIFATLLGVLLVSPSAWAATCELDNESSPPKTLTVPSQLMMISADAPASTSVPFAQFDTPPLNAKQRYIYCLRGEEYGKRALNLIGQDPSTRIYTTNIPGVGIKMLSSDGTNFGNFPSTAYLQFDTPGPTGAFTLSPASYYRIQFFKIADNLRLNNQESGDIVLPAGEIGYHYIVTPNPASFMMKLAIGEMRIISTPACTVDSDKIVDFNKVTATLLKAGVTRNLDFSIVCKTDYGSYSAKASMTSPTPSPDGSYILVEDAAGNKNRLGIQIIDGSNKLMRVDGSTSEQKNGTTSQGAAEFSWKARLIPSSQILPSVGAFSAKAEIVFDIQ